MSGVDTQAVLDMLGKRKRRSEEGPQTSPKGSGGCGSESEDVRDAFRRHFEAQFKPLEYVKLKTVEISTPTPDTDSDSEWDGFSEPEGKIRLQGLHDVSLIQPDTRTVEVVEYTAPSKLSLYEVPKEELKAFMV